jgi:Cdc6-like AAA superfamily ATPase
MRLFLGKFSIKYPEQIEKKYYSAQEKGNPWYGGVEPGDYVFVNYVGKIIALWKAKEYTNMKNSVNPKHDGVLIFDEIKTYNDISLTNDFTRYKHFVHNLDLVNKVSKSTKNLGFIPIKTTDNCPMPEDIDFKNNFINIYISLDDDTIDLNPKEGDIRVLINDLNEMKIVEIQKYSNGKFDLYKDFNDLYIEKSPERYTIKELNAYALEDNATQKRNFLLTLIDELEKNGFMKVSNPISLYDNLLVGRKKYIPPKVSPPPPPEQEDLDDENSEQYAEYAGLLNFNPNLILYGPPGTGKTYATRKIIDNFEKKYFSENSSYSLAEAENRVRTITFHQSYSYEEFIEGIRPILSNDEIGKIGYKLENGIFKDLCIKAEKELINKENNSKYIDKPYYIIIDEINRGNISKIFGELITLIEQDKRGNLKTILPYSKKEFTVPSNVYIIGTMNTADRSIAAIDTALRRRFTFVEIGPDSSILSQYDNHIVNDTVDLCKLMDAINDRILEKFDRDHRIGHAYFMGIESLNNLYQTWYYKILPLLGEYFYNDIESLTAIVGESFYDKNGNVQYLSLSKGDKGISNFEQKLIDIYE